MGCEKMGHDGSCSRREAIRGAARWAAMGTILLLSGGLGARRVLTSGVENCQRTLDCRRCAAWGECGLPEAVQARAKEG